MINFHAPRRWPPLIFLALLLAGVGGCLSLRLEEVGPAALLAGLPHDFASGKLSTQAQENLRTEKLDELWHRSPEAACRELSTRMLAEENQSPDKQVSHLLTLAEMYHHLAKGSTPGVTLHPDRWQDLQALFYARCAAYSAHAMAGLLREPEDQSSRMVGSLRTVDLAMDMHNNACLELTRLARNRGKLVPGGTLALKGPSATRPSENGSLEIVDVGIPLPLQEFGKLTPAGELRVVGLDCKHDRPGLGVPLLAHLRPVADGSKSIYLDGLKVPVSAHLVIPARLAEVPDWTRLEVRLVDPQRLETVDIAGQAVFGWTCAIFKPSPAPHLRTKGCNGLLRPELKQYARSNTRNYKWNFILVGLYRDAGTASRRLKSRARRRFSAYAAMRNAAPART